ncbi:MAG: hypothetical protein KC492_19925 [Myxococcales bacterium]|nr:hypothetical protein [Myxococcales bacterium]
MAQVGYRLEELTRALRGRELTDLRIAGVSEPPDLVLDNHAVFLEFEGTIVRFEGPRDVLGMRIDIVESFGVSSWWDLEDDDVVLSVGLLENAVHQAPCGAEYLRLWSPLVVDGVLVVAAAEFEFPPKREAARFNFSTSALFIDPCYYWGVRFGGSDVRDACFHNRPELVDAPQTVLELAG